MNDDELQARLRAVDPARHDAPADSWIDDLVEATVQEETMQETESRRARWLVPAAAAAAVAGIAAAAVIAFGGDDGGDGGEPTTLALRLNAQDSMQMCMALDAETLGYAEQAFSGTATDVEGTTVTIETDHWFKGGDADIVTVEAGDEAVLLEGGITFTEGDRYLVTAGDGTVGVCGTSGPYTQELAELYEEAFAG